MKKINKKRIAEILGVHYKSLLRWNNEKIVHELAKVCYKVSNISKEGKSVYFYVKYEEYSQDNDEHFKEVFKVKNVQAFKCYAKRKVESIAKKELITRIELCKETNTPEKTSKRYDKKLIENGVLENLNNILYICVDRKTKERVFVSREAYNNFWRKNYVIGKELKSLERKYVKNEIAIDDYNYLRDILISKSETQYMYYKVNKLAIKYDNYLYKMLMEEENNPLLFLGNIYDLAI